MILVLCVYLLLLTVQITYACTTGDTASIVGGVMSVVIILISGVAAFVIILKIRSKNPTHK